MCAILVMIILFTDVCGKEITLTLLLLLLLLLTCKYLQLMYAIGLLYCVRHHDGSPQFYEIEYGIFSKQRSVCSSRYLSDENRFFSFLSSYFEFGERMGKESGVSYASNISCRSVPCYGTWCASSMSVTFHGTCSILSKSIDTSDISSLDVPCVCWRRSNRTYYS